MKIKCKIIVFVTFISSFFTSCVIPKNIITNGNLCGIVIDENNKPVSDFVIYCRKNAGIKKATVTNKSGIFVFQNVDTGKYFIEGEKDNYVKIEKREYMFNNCSDLYCIQVMSFNECIKKVNSFAKTGEFEKGINLLNSVNVKPDSFNETLSNSYLAYYNYMTGNMDICNKYIDILKKIKNDKCSLFIRKMEDLVYE